MSKASSSLLSDVPKGSRIVVAMSGGVDSSVAAALMVEAGYDVAGITLQLYDHGAAIDRKGACCAGQDIRDARAVADRLGISHYVLDYETRFRQSVMEEFADAYARGETPVPCIRCNQTVKFRDLLTTAKDLGAEALVTGHYVRRVVGPQGAELHAAADGSKDQSYFLFATTPDQLSYLRFPLGDLTKTETRDLAARHGLAVAAKPDSQDICFVPNGSYARIVERLRPDAMEPGEIVDLQGRSLGRHNGIARFTIGQRKGLGLGAETPDSVPLYVVRLDVTKRQVVVGPREALATEAVSLKECNWLFTAGKPQALRVAVKLRNMAAAAHATLYPQANGMARIVLNLPQDGIAAGQACVVYALNAEGQVGSRVLGGGWISAAERVEVAA